MTTTTARPALIPNLAAAAAIPATLETDWDAVLKLCPMMELNSPDRPEGVREDKSMTQPIKIADFEPAIDRIYLHRPEPMKTNQAVLDAEIWYIYNTQQKLACKLKIQGVPGTSSGIRYFFKYDQNRTEEAKRKGGEPIRGFNVPIRLWEGAVPTAAESAQETKLRIATHICAVHFFRWKKAMGREGAEWRNLEDVLKGIRKTINYKIDEKGEVVQGRGPTLTLKTYAQGRGGKKPTPPDNVLLPEDWECTTKFFSLERGKQVQLTQSQLRQLMPEYLAIEMTAGRLSSADGDPSKFLFSIEPIFHFAKVRWAAKQASIARHVAQALIYNKRASGEADHTSWEATGAYDDGEDSGRSTFTSGLSWAAMGEALPTSTNTTTTTAQAPSAATTTTTTEEGEDEEDGDDEEDEHDTVAPPAQAPPPPAPAAPIVKPGIIPEVAAAAAAATATAPKSRRAPKRA